MFWIKKLLYKNNIIKFIKNNVVFNKEDKIKLTEIQFEFIDALIKNKYLFAWKGSNSEVTTTIIIYSIWKALFKKNTSIFIGSVNVGVQKNTFSKIYNNLPSIIKKQFNIDSTLTTVKFKNGNSIVFGNTKYLNNVSVTMKKDYSDIFIDEVSFISSITKSDDIFVESRILNKNQICFISAIDGMFRPNMFIHDYNFKNHMHKVFTEVWLAH